MLQYVHLCENYAKNIRIHHECEGGTQKSIPMLTLVNKVCQVMPNGDLKENIFISNTNTNNGRGLMLWLFVGPTRVCLLDFFCYSNQFYLMLSPYLCFISFLYLDFYVLGDDALIR